MKIFLTIIINIYFSLSLFCQSDSTYFSDAIKINFNKYKVQSETAYRTGDTERGQFLFDSLVNHRLKNTIFDDFALKKIKGGKLKLHKSDKPVILLTYASWCVFSKGEIPALNKLARKYSKDAHFVVLFWDRKHNVRKIARKFNHNITVCYAHEYYKNDAPLVAALKHTLGFPTSLYLDENMRIVDIRRCSVYEQDTTPGYKKSYALNYNSFLKGLNTILIDKELKKEMLAVN